MSQTITLTIDGVEIEGGAGRTIIEAADAAGVYIPRLCHQSGLEPHGSCRVCTVLVNGRPVRSFLEMGRSIPSRSGDFPVIRAARVGLQLG